MTEVPRRRILVTGATGQVGWELLRTLQSLGEVMATTLTAPAGEVGNARRVLNLADPDAIRALLREWRPQLIVNAAAYTAVDRAEDDVDMAMAINATAPGVMAEEAKHYGAVLVHYSTEYVFDGNATTPYTETDAPNPRGVYGKSKLAGERAIQQVDGAHLIFRTSWVYGLRGKNFLLTILRLARERPELNVVDDQIGAPNWSRLLAEATAQVLATQLADANEPSGAVLERMRGVQGLYHLACAGTVSWCGFARALLTIAESPCQVNSISSAEYPLRAPRPLNSRLNTNKFTQTFGLALPDWEDALRLCMADLP